MITIMNKINLIHRINVLLVTAFISMAAIYGCGDSTTTPTQADNLSFSGVSSDDSVGDAQNYLILDTVKILIKDIKIKYANTNDDSTDFKV